MTDSLDDLNAEDLDCLRAIGLRFVNRSDVFADISAEIQREEQAEVMMSALGAGNAFKPPANPAPAKPRRQRKPSLRKMIAAAERDGKIVTSITTPDGVTLHFGKVDDTDAANPWLDDLKVTKQ